jgi:hypothetical protein
MMKKPSLIFLTVGLLSLTAAHAQRGATPFNEPEPERAQPEPPPRVWENPNYYNPFASNTPPLTASTPAYVYDQKLYGGRAPLVTQEQAQGIIDRFKEAYPRLGSPRFLIYVNRDLVNQESGMKLIKREEKTESVRGGTNSEPSFKSTGENSYRADDKPAPTLADKQTVRDVERLFGRPLRAGGATLADQSVAAQLIADRPLAEFIGSTDTPQARKDREALGQITDVVIEILISSKTLDVNTISGTQTYSVPDIQATAIRLKDSRILAQASSRDVGNRVPPYALAQYSVDEITEATALELMEDLAQ